MEDEHKIKGRQSAHPGNSPALQGPLIQPWLPSSLSPMCPLWGGGVRVRLLWVALPKLSGSFIHWWAVLFTPLFPCSSTHWNNYWKTSIHQSLFWGSGDKVANTTQFEKSVSSYSFHFRRQDINQRGARIWDGDKHQGKNQDRRMRSFEGGTVLKRYPGKTIVTDWDGVKKTWMTFE